MRHVAAWSATELEEVEIPFPPARVVLQDFTGVPAVVDLAAMRSAMKRLGGDPQRINPLIPVDLVIDHSVQVDRFGSPDALQANIDFELRGTANGMSSSAGASARWRTSASCLPAWGSCTR